MIKLSPCSSFMKTECAPESTECWVVKGRKLVWLEGNQNIYMTSGNSQELVGRHLPPPLLPLSLFWKPHSLSAFSASFSHSRIAKLEISWIAKMEISCNCSRFAKLEISCNHCRSPNYRDQLGWPAPSSSRNFLAWNWQPYLLSTQQPTYYYVPLCLKVSLFPPTPTTSA